jgi:hypothetical protein
MMTKKPDQGSALTSTARVSDHFRQVSDVLSPQKFHRDNKKKGKVVGMDEIHSPFDLTAEGNTIQLHGRGGRAAGCQRSRERE